jgi:MFS family permease
LVANVFIFEVGSVVCAAAPTSNALIAGRAITGAGAAGIVVGGLAVITNLVPLRKRPKYQGFVGALFGLASIIGPTVGGAFTTHLSWRWCFWISVPIAGVALAGLIFVLPASEPPAKLEGPIAEAVKRFDPVGNLIVIPGIVCLLLGLQWGPIYSWRSSRVVTLLVLGPALLATFAAVQFWVRENGTIPPRIICQRSIAAGAIVTLGVGAALISSTFYLPIYFQAIRGTSAATAGVRLLPYFLSTVIFVIASGIAVSKLGYYTPFLIGGCAVLIVGTALLTTFRVDTGIGQWVGYQVSYP